MNRVIGLMHAESISVGAADVTELKGVSATRPNQARWFLTVQNNGASDVFLGGPGVSSANGYKLAAGASYSADIAGGLFARTAAGSVDVRILEGF